MAAKRAYLWRVKRLNSAHVAHLMPDVTFNSKEDRPQIWEYLEDVSALSDSAYRDDRRLEARLPAEVSGLRQRAEEYDRFNQLVPICCLGSLDG